MHFTTFLKKYFDIEIKMVFDPLIEGGNERGKEVNKIWVYEKGEDCEPLLILTDAWWYTDNKQHGFWIVGNIYSTMEDGSCLHEDKIREAVKAGKVISKYK